MSGIVRQTVVLSEASGAIAWEVDLILDGSGFQRKLDVSVKRVVLLPNAPKPVEVATMSAGFTVVKIEQR